MQPGFIKFDQSSVIPTCSRVAVSWTLFFRLNADRSCGIDLSGSNNLRQSRTSLFDAKVHNSARINLASLAVVPSLSSGFVTGGYETMVSSCSSPMVFCMQVRLSFVEMVVRRDLEIWMSSFRFLFRFLFRVLSHRSFSYGIKSRAPLLWVHLFFFTGFTIFLEITLFQNY